MEYSVALDPTFREFDSHWRDMKEEVNTIKELHTQGKLTIEKEPDGTINFKTVDKETEEAVGLAISRAFAKHYDIKGDIHHKGKVYKI